MQSSVGIAGPRCGEADGHAGLPRALLQPWITWLGHSRSVVGQPWLSATQEHDSRLCSLPPDYERSPAARSRPPRNTEQNLTTGFTLQYHACLDVSTGPRARIVGQRRAKRTTWAARKKKLVLLTALGSELSYLWRTVTTARWSYTWRKTKKQQERPKGRTEQMRSRTETLFAAVCFSSTAVRGPLENDDSLH